MAELKEKLVEVWHKWKLTYMESVEIEEVVKYTEHKNTGIYISQEFYETNKDFFINKEELFNFMNESTLEDVIIKELSRLLDLGQKKDRDLFHITKMIAIYLTKVSEKNNPQITKEKIEKLSEYVSQDSFISRIITHFSSTDELDRGYEDIREILLEEIKRKEYIKEYLHEISYGTKDLLQLELKHNLFYTIEEQIQFLKEEFEDFSCNHYIFIYSIINKYNIKKTNYKTYYKIFYCYRKEIFKYFIKDLHLRKYSLERENRILFTYLDFLELNDGKNIIDKTIDKILTNLENSTRTNMGKINQQGLEKIITKILYLSKDEKVLERLYKVILNLKRNGIDDVTCFFHKILAVYDYEKLIKLLNKTNTTLNNEEFIELVILELRYSYYIKSSIRVTFSSQFLKNFIEINCDKMDYKNKNQETEFIEWVLTGKTTFDLIEKYYPNLTKDLYVYHLLKQEIDFKERHLLLNKLIRKNNIAIADELLQKEVYLESIFWRLKQLIKNNIDFVEDEKSKKIIKDYVDSIIVDEDKFNQLKSYLYSKYEGQMSEKLLLSQKKYNQEDNYN